MKKEEATFVWPRRELKVSLSPSPVPCVDGYQQDELRFLSDRYYALHGEIMASVIILIFVLFIVFVVAFSCFRRAHYCSTSANSGCSSPAAQVKRRSQLPETTRAEDKDKINQGFQQKKNSRNWNTKETL